MFEGFGILDNRASAIGLELKQEVLNVMLQLTKEGMTIVVVIHEMIFAKQVGTELIFMEHGKIAVDDGSRTVIEKIIEHAHEGLS